MIQWSGANTGTPLVSILMAGACHLTSLNGVNYVSDVAKDVHQKAYGPLGNLLSYQPKLNPCHLYGQDAN